MDLFELKSLPRDSPRAGKPLPVAPFEYSDEFKQRIVEIHRGMEGLPKYREHLEDNFGGPASRLTNFARYLCPEIEYRCGPLSDLKVLDFGCGTGASTAALAAYSGSVHGFDIDRESMDICRMRLAEHGLESRVTLHSAPSLEDVKDLIGSVDLVLMCGVIEHLPLTDDGLRERTIRSLVGMLKVPGYLYIYDTPNRLWPYDFHSTRLWWIPWMKPGSKRAYERAVKSGRHIDTPRSAPGPRGMEQGGAWGATYREIRGYLRGEPYECLNTRPGNNKHIDYMGGARRYRLIRYPFDFFAGLITRPLKIPITALYPFLDNLVIMKTAPTNGGLLGSDDYSRGPSNQ